MMLNSDNVYNYYTIQYSSVYNKPATKYDSHKTNELRTIYNKMINLNRGFPLYKVTLSEDIEDYILDVKSAAIELKNSTLFLSECSEDGQSDYTVKSSDENILIASMVNNSTPTFFDNFKVQINSLATSQINQGIYISSSDLDIPPKNYTFAIDISNNSYSYQLTTKSTDTNISIQKRILNFINKSNVGIMASLSTKGKKTALMLTSNSTGYSNKDSKLNFTISDVNTNNGLVKKLSLNKVLNQPRNSSFTVNKKADSSSSNEITLNNSVKLKFISSSPEEISINIVPDSAGIVDKISDFAYSYNNMIDIAEKHINSQRNSRKLKNDLYYVSTNHKDDLENIGLNLEENGSLLVNSNRIVSTIQNDGLEKLTTDIKSFSDDIIDQALDVSLNPMAYVDKTIITYPNTKLNFVNPYMPSIYTGMLYNRYL